MNDLTLPERLTNAFWALGMDSLCDGGDPDPLTVELAAEDPEMVRTSLDVYGLGKWLPWADRETSLTGSQWSIHHRDGIQLAAALEALRANK
ncbi:hypothetical protein [Streptomyces goshikiensis]|uniref:hypothetical protein n=1 Tax=Streptomyces goshikiensis TaxID=1942 RepID=UPI00369456D1